MTLRTYEYLVLILTKQLPVGLQSSQQPYHTFLELSPSFYIIFIIQLKPNSPKAPIQFHLFNIRHHTWHPKLLSFNRQSSNYTYFINIRYLHFLSSNRLLWETGHGLGMFIANSRETIKKSNKGTNVLRKERNWNISEKKLGKTETGTKNNSNEEKITQYTTISPTVSINNHLKYQ